MKQVDDEREKSDLAFVKRELEKAQNHIDKGEEEWQLSGGYGSRSSLNRWYNYERICNLALRAVENQCSRCAKRHKDIYRAMKTLEERENSGKEDISIEDAKRLINSIW